MWKKKKENLTKVEGEGGHQYSEEEKGN